MMASLAATPPARAAWFARWGVLPSWIKEPGTLAQPINAKLETAAVRA